MRRRRSPRFFPVTSVSSHGTGSFKNSDTRYRSLCGLIIALRLNTYCSAGIKKGLFVFRCEFVHLMPARRKTAISMLSAY